MRTSFSRPVGVGIVVSILVMGGLGAGERARAAPGAPSAPATSDGNYTVTPNGCNDYHSAQTCAGQWVEERIEPSGTYFATNGTFTGKPPGVYTYRTADMYCDLYFTMCVTRYSTTVSVAVGNVPARDPLEAQQRYTFRARTGHVVGDSGTDILIERTTGGEAGNGVIDAVILEQRAAGTFAPVVPTSAQRNSGAWLDTGLDVAVEDINVDGFVDVVVGSVGTAIAGAADQIVFSSGVIASEAPKGVRALDPTLAQFTGNMLDYMVDTRYFVDNAPLTSVYFVYTTHSCPSLAPVSYDENGWHGFLTCYTSYYFGVAQVPDYSGFNPSAVDIWIRENSLEQGLLSRAQAVGDISSLVRDMIGVDIGGWDLDEVLGTTGPHDDPLWTKGLEAFISIIGIGRAHADEIETDEAPRQIERQTNVIYITGRYVFGTGTEKLHSSLYYRFQVPNWFSAFDSDPSLLGDGKLVGATNDPRDNPLLMRFTLGTVTPPAPLTPYYYFYDELGTAQYHYEGLPDAWLADYDAIPEIPACGGCAGRNSNGYVNGLVLATGGTAEPLPPLRFEAMFGWEYPVEAFYFGR